MSDADGTMLDGTVVDVSSTLITLGRAHANLGTRSLSLTRITTDDAEPSAVSLSESSRRYEHLRLLGRGGMGQVDQVWDHDLMRKLAVKRLHPDRANSSPALRQFLWEARVTAHLDHPNIVPVHDLSLDDQGDLYFTMKFVHGTSLDELLGALARVEQANAEGTGPTHVDEVITAEHLTALRRVRLFIDLCQAIAYAHERGVLHRDLKPANVMIGQYGEVLIMDWGLAFPLPGPAGENLRELLPDPFMDRRPARPNRPTGTPRYMSPEQVRAQPLDQRSDIYSLGVILYELLCLRSPYSATEFTRLLAQVSEGDIQPLTETGPSVPDALIHVVNRAMATDPDDRYPSVRALTDDIETVLDAFSPTLGAGQSGFGEAMPIPMSRPVTRPVAQASPMLAPAAPTPQPEPAPTAAPTGRASSASHIALTLGAGVLGGLAIAGSIRGALAELPPVSLLALAVVALGLLFLPLRALLSR
ncbi:serine/threonine protein kinase [Enhygromyxa salina]|nr:serine/threonine-protein kinase [Enhygromyxa salina]